MNELPHGWCLTPIEAISTKPSQKIPEESEEFFYLDIGSVDRESKRIVCPDKIYGLSAPSRARQVVRAGDILVSMTRPNLNAVALVPKEYDQEVASTGFDILRPFEVDPRWLYAAVRTKDFVDTMSNLVQGALYPAVRPRDIRGYEIPLAPLPEQKRIADKLDTLLARVGATRTGLDRIPLLLKLFRKSVLAAATSGRLTESWRNSVGMSTWNESKVPLEALLIPGRKLSYGVLKPGEHDMDGIRMLKSGQVRDGFLDLQEDYRISKELSNQFRKTTLQGGEVLLNLVGASIGRSAVATSEVIV